MLVTPDPPAQLVKIAQAKAVRTVNDDCVRIRNIESTLDDGCRKQHIRFAVDELRHHFLKFIRFHLAVADDDAGIGHQHL